MTNNPLFPPDFFFFFKLEVVHGGGKNVFKVALSKAARQIVLFWGFFKGKVQLDLDFKSTVVALASTDGKLDLPNC